MLNVRIGATRSQALVSSALKKHSEGKIGKPLLQYKHEMVD